MLPVWRAARNRSTAFTLALSTGAGAGAGAPRRMSVTPGSANADDAKRRREQSRGACFILSSTDTTPRGTRSTCGWVRSGSDGRLGPWPKRRRIRCRRDPLLEELRVGRARERFVAGDLPGDDELLERLIQRHHALGRADPDHALDL